ncbi:MAG: hypothetical protein IJ588_04025 [Prevotella sp.]|nr:hypothetical protein [Prevotella sp.]
MNVSIGGVAVRSGWSDDYERTVMDDFGLVVGKFGAGHGPGTLVYFEWDETPKLNYNSIYRSVSYYYHCNHHVALGGLVGYCSVKDNLGYSEVNRWSEELQRTGETFVRGTSLFLMPSVKWSWLNNQWCSLYMKATAGVHYQSLYLESETIPEEQLDGYDKYHLGLGYYVTPFGWEIGKQKVRWFIEFGLGSNNNFQMGLTYRFGRF